MRDSQGRFVKGYSGNPSGRPSREHEKRYFDVTLAAVSVEDWQAIVTRAIHDAKRGDTSARKWLADYVLGLPVQKLEQLTDGVLEILVNYNDDSTE